MNSRDLKKFILPVLVVIILFFVFTCGGSSDNGGSLPLGLGQDLKGSSFTNISRFGSSDQMGSSGIGMTKIEKYPNGRPVTIPTNMVLTKVPGGTPLSLNQQIEGMIIKDQFFRKIEGMYGSRDPPSSINAFIESTSSEDLKNKIKNLNSKDAAALALNMFALISSYGKALKPGLEYCVKNPRERECLGIEPVIRALEILLNTDIINNVPKVGSGWDEYTIESATVTKDTSLVITPSIDFSSKKIKFVMLKYRGKEQGSTTSKVIVSLGGKNSAGASLGDYSNATSFFDDPGDFHYDVFVLPLEYPVTIDSVSIKLTCPGTSAAIDDALICFVYQ